MKRVYCWWAHRPWWTVIRPGPWPFLLGAERWCPFCSKPPRALPLIYGELAFGRAS